ncbi:methyl-accepting chemotaxis protein [Cytobacillus sp. IB215316]|uniref:methyl-accepting chemotaxis protein n=1 Tax=Cytobacillus sp. IB215316 TaxID=3097354 RepID=UPI002A0E04E3|nr:methyl-accepting chemotaxis protein [Cytobacillus sp. IB215316]MDX8361426.1 methyl-accepting chemotaxis protein [Cytobacillus sp. IB215316]
MRKNKNTMKIAKKQPNRTKTKINIHGIGIKINLLFLVSMITTGLLLILIITPYVTKKMEENIQTQSLMVAETQLQSLQGYVNTTVEEITLMSEMLKNETDQNISKGYSRMRSSNSKFLDIYHINDRGNEELRQGYSISPSDRSNDEAYQNAMQAGLFVGKVKESNYTLGPVFTLEVSKVVTDLVKKPIGVIGTYIDIRTAWRELRGTASNTDQNMFLVSSDGFGVASDEQSQLETNDQELMSFLDHEGVSDMVAKVEGNEFAEDASLLSGVGVFKDENGDEQVTSYVYDHELGIAVFVDTPVSIAFGVVTEIRNVIILIIVISQIVITFIAFIFSNRLVKPLKKLMNVAQRIAKGDLTNTTNIMRKDEIGQLAKSFDDMIISLNGIVRNTKEASNVTLNTSEQLRQTANEVAISSEQITAAIDEIAQGSEYQAAISQETDDKIDQFMEIATQIDKQRNEVVTTAEETQDTIVDNQTILEDVITGVQALANATDQSSTEVKILEDRTNQIRTILETSRDIADQTNLLALNASIEAARAGEHGKGFAVVADEVRKLAEESRNASNKVEEIISSVLDSISNVNKTMIQSIEQAQKETEAAAKAKTALLQINASMDKVVLTINSMNDLLGEQKTSVTSIQDHSKQSSSYAMETTSSTEEVAASATETAANMATVSEQIENLLSMSQELNKSVERFKVKQDN